MVDNNGKKSLLTELNRLRGEALGLMGIIVSLIVKWDDFAALYRLDPFQFILALLLALFAVSWFYGFYKAGLKEQQWLEKYLEPDSVPSLGIGTYVVVFLLAVSFVLLVYFSDHILYYSASLTILCLLDLWSGFLVYSKIRAALIKTMCDSKSGFRKSASRILDKYYFGNPWPHRVATTMLLDAVAFMFAYQSAETNGASASASRITAYVVILVANILSASLQSYWRYCASKALNRLGAEGK